MIKRCKVPDGMFEAALDYSPSVAHGRPQGEDALEIKMRLEAALRWLDLEIEKMIIKSQSSGAYNSSTLADDYQRNGYDLAIINIRKIYAVPDLEISEAVKDLLFDSDYLPTVTKGINERIVEAYKRGQQSFKATRKGS